MKSNHESIRCYILKETELAYGIKFDQNDPEEDLTWIPKSQVGYCHTNKEGQTKMEIPTWLADKIL